MPAERSAGHFMAQGHTDIACRPGIRALVFCPKPRIFLTSRDTAIAMFYFAHSVEFISVFNPRVFYFVGRRN